MRLLLFLLPLAAFAAVVYAQPLEVVEQLLAQSLPLLLDDVAACLKLQNALVRDEIPLAVVLLRRRFVLKGMV